MKNIHTLIAIVLFVAMNSATLSSQERVGIDSIRDRFVGAWRLAWLEEQGADGKVHKAECTGLLVYTRDGHMSVQVMYRNPPSENKAAPVQYAQGGYEASFGKYEINDTHIFTFHVEGALVRGLIGKDLKRVYELSGNQLTVKSPDPAEHWRVVWERY
jgi:hypothetical protein